MNTSSAGGPYSAPRHGPVRFGLHLGVIALSMVLIVMGLVDADWRLVAFASVVSIVGMTQIYFGRRANSGRH